MLVSVCVQCVHKDFNFVSGNSVSPWSCFSSNQAVIMEGETAREFFHVCVSVLLLFLKYVHAWNFLSLTK